MDLLVVGGSGYLIARRDGLDPTRLLAGDGGPSDMRLDSSTTQARLTTRLRGAREFLGVLPG